MPVAYIRDPIALVGDLVARVRYPVALIGRVVSFLRPTLSLIELAAPLLQPGGLRTGAPSGIANLLGDSTLRGGLVASSALLAALGVLLGQSSAALEHLGRAREDSMHAQCAHRSTYRRARPRFQVRGTRDDPLVAPRLELIGSSLARVCHPISFVGDALALVGHLVSFVGATLSQIKLAAPLLQLGGLRPRAPSCVTRPVDDSTRAGGLIASSALLASRGVLLSQTGPLLEHLGRAHKSLNQAP